MTRTLCGLLLGCFAAVAAAQDFATPTIVSEGTATISVQPEFVSFGIERYAGGESAKAAVAEANAFEEELRAALDEAELTAAEFTLGAVTFVDRTSVRRRADLRFSMGGFDTPDDRANHVADLVDRVSAVCDKLEAGSWGPYLEPASKETAEQTAVERATENALYRADAIATLIAGQIMSVVQATIVDVSWGDSNEEKGGEFGLGTVKALECTARVEVAYSVGG